LFKERQKIGYVTGRGGKSSKQLLDAYKEMRRYWKLKEDALDRTPQRTRCRELELEMAMDLLLDDLEEMRRYFKLKEEALDRML
jgi:hypothetical protein